MSVLGKILSSQEYWLRLSVFLHEPLKKAVLNIFHNSQHGGLPQDPKALYDEFKQNHEGTLKSLKTKSILKDDHFLLIFPKSGHTDSSKFDVTLLAILIRNCLQLKKPIKGWNCRNPPGTDTSLASDVIRAREWRNFLHHNEPHDINETIFESQWQLGVDIVTRLGLKYDTNSLKEVALEPERLSVVHSLLDLLQIEQERMKAKVYLNETSISNLTLLINKTETIRDEVASFTSTHNSNAEKYSIQINSIFEAQNLFESKLLEIQTTLKTQKIKDLSQKFVLYDALARLCEIIGPQWKSLANQLKVPSSFIDEISATTCDHKDLMSLCFHHLNYEIQWPSLKAGLQFVRRVDVIEQITSSTLVTYGLQNAYLELQKKYIEELFNWYINEPFISHDGMNTACLPRDEAYVDLAIINASKMDKFWSVSERDFHLKLKHFEKADIKMDEIISKTDLFVLARGIAGIGKSTLMDTFTFQWAKGKLLSGIKNQPKINFLFKITCRDLNSHDDLQSSHTIITKCFPKIFDYVDLEDLEDVSHHVLVIIEGIDELQCLNEIKPHHISIKNKKAQVIFNLMDPKSNFLQNRKTIVTSRPEACRTIISYMQRKLKVKIIEVCGFSASNVNLYVENYFGKNKTMIDKIKKKLKESDNLLAMSSIPVYLWVICGVFKEDFEIETPLTTTQLNNYACLIFLRNHLKNHSTNFQQLSLYDLCNSSEIIEIIDCLAVLSELTLRQGEVIFHESDAMESKHLFEKTGFICKHFYGENGTFYQFRHLVLQEYFAALNLYLSSKNILEDIGRSCFTNCLPFLAGFCGIDKSSKHFINQLLANLKQFKVSKNKFTCNNTEVITKYLQDSIHNRIEGDCLFIDETFLNTLSSVYEYFKPLSLKLPSNLAVDIKNIHQHHDIKNLLYLVDTLSITNVNHISITNTGNQILPKNFCKLFKMFFNSNFEEGTVVRKVLKLIGNQTEMTVEANNESIDEVDNSILSKQVIIGMPNAIDGHQTFLLNLIHLVDNVILDVSLEASYVNVKKIFSENYLQKYESNVFYSNLVEHFENKNNHITPFNMMMLSDYAEKSIKSGSELQLTELILDSKSIRDEHLEILKPALFQIQSLSLNWNTQIGRQGLSAITRSLQTGLKAYKRTWMRNLHLVDCNLMEEEIQVLASIVIFLHYLNISWNQNIPPSSLMYLSNAICNKREKFKKNKRLSVIMSNCKLTDEHIMWFRPCICYLNVLDISMNEALSPRTMPVFNKCSDFDGRHLLSLDLRCCDLTDDHIIQLISGYVQFNYLELHGNPKLSFTATRLVDVILMHYHKIKSPVSK